MTNLDEALEQALAQVRDDAGLRELLKVARSWGVPPSRILGRRTVEQVVEVDELGRPARYVTPPWPVEDVALALALERFDADTCSGCGHQLSETTARDNQFRFVGMLPTRCHACTAIQRTVDATVPNTTQPEALRYGAQMLPDPAVSRVV